MRPQQNRHESPHTLPYTRPREPCDQRIAQFELFFYYRADRRPCVTSGLRVDQQKPLLGTGYINQDTILTTNYSSTGGRKSGKDGAHASATAADAPNLEPTAASRSRAARAGDSTHG